MIIVKKYKNKILCGSGSLFLGSFSYFLCFSKKTFHETNLGCCVLVTFICSELFWVNPIKHSLTHKIDSIVAKTSISYFVSYIYFVKVLPQIYYYYFTLMFIGMIYYALKSHLASSKEWCSDEHIKYHFLLHIFCFIGSLYAFV